MLRDSIGMRESLAIVADRHKGIEYATSIVYLDVDFGICVQYLAANLKTRYKDFKGHMKTYFDGASREYLVSEHQCYMELYGIVTPTCIDSSCKKILKNDRDHTSIDKEWLSELLQRWFVDKREESLKLTSKLAPKVDKLLCIQFSLGLTVTPQLTDQFKYAVTNKATQTCIVDMRERTCACLRFQVDQISYPHAMAVCNHR
ncbi:hypothetical protein TIFTF001_018677 [Ficus carica]|uniref:SWIM-type domain-containing protein n=1 Tax=Ficus carica TaxID=3494 RepID=A0AA88ABH3_FICCA|nr:hypothetical protein TIFTF001_018677 [Ficus carica]